MYKKSGKSSRVFPSERIIISKPKANRYEYEINGLVGTFDDNSLPGLLEVIIENYDNLIYKDLCSLEYCTDTRAKAIITPLYQNTYDTVDDLTSAITSDLQTVLPEHFI